MNGVLVVDKPVGPTSFDVVARVRRAARVKRVGHGGTLDPLASGVLPVCVGEATKLAPFLLDAEKAYEFTVRFGVETDTDDAGGRVTATADASGLDAAAVEAALGTFRGPISQVPPAYAAIKREGRALYDYARAGETIEVAPRAVTIFALELVDFGGPEQVALRVHCSKGTYVRALARDLGRALGTGGSVTALRRTRSGPFTLDRARPLDQVLAALAAGAGDLQIVSLADALVHLPAVTTDEALARRLRAGQRVAWSALTDTPPGRVRVLDPAGELIAVAEPRPDGLVGTLRVFGAASQKPAADLTAIVDEGAIL
ncbi:MAG TPA: tRNA pseudouridine(55) synthase TruB [Polyangia bacterium]|nr:tRNA pseudouridine(55) synthase TruB [Polyangia bacterium]